MLSAYRVERRKFKRLQVSLSVLCRVMWPWDLIERTQGSEFETEASDISLLGMALLSRQNFPVGTKLFLKVIIFEFNGQSDVRFHEAVILYGRIRSIGVLSDGRFRLGMCFEDMDAFKKRAIEDIFESSLRYEARIEGEMSI